MRDAVHKYLHLTPLVVGPGMKTGLNIALDNPATMGSDLVVGAAAALAIHDPPLIIIDMGTATTMTVIDREARVLGGAIIPGVGISLEALANGSTACGPCIRKTSASVKCAHRRGGVTELFP